MTMRTPVRIIDARAGKIRWNWNYVENAHISQLYDRGEVDLRMLSKRKAAEVVEYMAAHESINKAANACITLTDEEIELLTNYAELNGDEASYLRVLCFMLKEGLYDNCVLWLPMTRNLRAGINDTDTEVYDRSPFGNHGTIHGAVWQTLPSGKSALSFDGVDDYVEVSNSESLQDIKKITVVAWIYPHTGYGQEYPRIVERGQVEPFRFYITASNGLLIVGLNTVSGTFYRASETAIPENKWTMVAFTYDGIYLRIFLNGNLDKETTENAGDLDTFSTITYIGSSPAGNRTFNGTIDEVRIYNRALSEEKIERLYELTRVFYGV